jgi:hypothetical protein
MHVVQLTAENFKRLVAVDITPQGNAVVIAGANAQGKTSVLDAIWAALGGKAASPERPIRDGAKTATVTVDLGDLKVTRTWKNGGGSSLTVTNASGGKVSGPQAILDQLVGKLAFDPLQFALADDKTQLATLLSVVELPFDPGSLAQQRQAVYDQRTEVNREVKRLEGALASMPAVPAGTPDEEVSAVVIAGQLQQRQQADAELERATRRWQEIEAEITRLREEQQQVIKVGERAAAAVQQLPTADHLMASLQQAEQVNAAVRAKKQRGATELELLATRTHSDVLTERIAELDQRKVDGIAAAQMPVPGLGFDDDGVTLNGVPFKQASAAERLRTSVAIAMAKNPQVRVILIRDASLLDSANLAVITQMAAEQSYQVWLERVGDADESGIVIEEGQVR